MHGCMHAEGSELEGDVNKESWSPASEPVRGRPQSPRNDLPVQYQYHTGTGKLHGCVRVLG